MYCKEEINIFILLKTNIFKEKIVLAEIRFWGGVGGICEEFIILSFDIFNIHSHFEQKLQFCISFSLILDW